MGVPRWVGRAIGLDVHREFCEVAICEDGRGAVGGPGAGHTGGGEVVGGEPAAIGSGGVGGDGQLLGGRADPRAACQPCCRGVA